MDFAAAKALLQRQEGGASVYSHLTEVILKLLTDQPADALAAFESISAAVKGGAFPAQAPGNRAGGAAAAPEVSAARSALVAKQMDLYKVPGTEEGPAPEPEGLQDLTEEANYLEWAGVALGRTEAFRLHLSMKHLVAANAGLRNLRFWGKIFSTQRDYLVVEGQMDAEDEEPEDAKDALGNTIQRTGSGPNKHVYFVTHGVGEAWTKLPNVTPHQLIVARQIRRFFTGDLSASVSGHPPFPGVESNLLRAQIALISAGTSIAPSGMFNAVDGDEDGNIAPNEEEWDAPDLSQADSWVHTALEINALGRTKPNPPTVNDEGEEVADPDAPEPSAPLRPVADDPPVAEDEEEGGGAWDIRPLPVTGVPEGEPTPLVLLRSLRWPGAVTVGFSKKRFVSAYVGFGLEVRTTSYAPTLPGAVGTEFDHAGTGGGEAGPAPPITEQPDVISDPDAGKPAEDEEQQDEE